MTQQQAIKVAFEIDEFVGRKEFLDACIKFKIGTVKGSIFLDEPQTGGGSYTLRADLSDISKIRRVLLQIGWVQSDYDGSVLEPIWKGF